MSVIRIVYIDDELDTNISRYIAKEYKHEKVEITYNEKKFNSVDGYESLIKDDCVKESNIILIDSKLFENNKVNNDKFSGEEFKMILKKVFPFIEVIVITQNELEEEYGTFSKYKGREYGTAQEYYSNKLKKVLDEAIKSVTIYRNIADKLKNNAGIDKVLIEKILNSLEGKAEYDELTTNDIDNIINAFREIERDINGK